MTIHETIEEQRQREQQPCFLCALDPHPCAVSQLAAAGGFRAAGLMFRSSKATPQA